MLVRAEVISGVHASMLGPSGELLGYGDRGPLHVAMFSDYLQFTTDRQRAQEHSSLPLKCCGTVYYETDTHGRGDSSASKRTTQG